MTSDPPQICFVVNAVDQTTAEVDIAVALQRYTDVEVTVLAWFEVESFYGDELVDVIEIGAPQTTAGIDLNSLAALYEAIGDFDLIQTTHNHAGAFAKVLAHAQGVPSVSREGNTRDGFPLLGLIANGLTNPLSTKVVCNSRAVRDSFRCWESLLLDQGSIEVIPNGVNLAAIDDGEKIAWSVHDENEIRPESMLVGTAGSLTEQKNYATLIRGVATVRDRGEPVELVVAGDGPLRDALAELATDKGISESVHFLGDIERERVYKLFHEIDIYAMPSLWEGFSMAAVEAAGSETPCVFSDIAPFWEPYGDLAMFHEPTDAEGLADCLAALVGSSKQQAQLGEALRERVTERYTIEAVAKRYRAVYAVVI